MGGLGGGPSAEKQPQQRFFNPQLILQLYMWGPTFFRGGGGPDAYFHKNTYIL